MNVPALLVICVTLLVRTVTSAPATGSPEDLNVTFASNASPEAAPSRFDTKAVRRRHLRSFMAGTLGPDQELLPEVVVRSLRGVDDELEDLVKRLEDSRGRREPGGGGEQNEQPARPTQARSAARETRRSSEKPADALFENFATVEGGGHSDFGDRRAGGEARDAHERFGQVLGPRAAGNGVVVGRFLGRRLPLLQH